METTQTAQSLYQALWNSADVLRSKMDANDYKSLYTTSWVYIPMILTSFLSKILDFITLEKISFINIQSPLFL